MTDLFLLKCKYGVFVPDDFMLQYRNSVLIPFGLKLHLTCSNRIFYFRTLADSLNFKLQCHTCDLGTNEL